MGLSGNDIQMVTPWKQMHYSVRKTYFNYSKTNLTNIDGFFSSSSGGSKGVKSIPSE